MRSAVFVAWLLIGPAVAWNQDPATNVNSRYTVESIDVPTKFEKKLSGGIRAEMQKLVGEKFSQEAVDRLSGRIRRELRGYNIGQRIVKGTKPENVRIVYDVIRGKDKDVVLPRLAYHSKQNFTFGADGSWDADGHVLSLGILTDNDELIERYSGIRGGYERALIEGRFVAGVKVESWRSQWNGAVTDALARQTAPAGSEEDVPGVYRTRLHVNPGFSWEVVPGVEVSAGVSLQRFETQFPAARHESSHALTSSLRLRQRWELLGLGNHSVDAGYSLRAATRSLGSDFAYTRHAFNAGYKVSNDRNVLEAQFMAGYLNGRAPLFDRFLLGNTKTLRGYNKYDVAPLGGSRMVHGSLDYRHRWARVVYDTGTVYSRGQRSRVLHSLAIGLTAGLSRDSLTFLVAFPLKEGRAEPIFLMGINF